MKCTFDVRDHFNTLWLVFFITLLASCDRSPLEAEQEDAVKRYKAQDPVLFLSTQFNPLEEANKIRKILSSGYDGQVNFQANDNNFIFRQLTNSEQQSEDILVGALHGDILNLYRDNMISPVNDVLIGMDDRAFADKFINLSRQADDNYYYVPWMQATYIMAANVKALPYLPEGAELSSLTYAQLLQWATNIKRETAENRLGFPIGEKGLIHRFFQGYLYPSFTGRVITAYASEDAVAMWQYFQDLWKVTSKKSLSYTIMSEPLMIDEVWIAWDHTARLLPAFEKNPENFVAFPAPAGPKGRSFMAVVSGLALPKGSQQSASAVELIRFLTDPEIQAQTVKATGFFPTVEGVDLDALPLTLKELATAVVRQSSSSDAIATLLPSGLGEMNSHFNELFLLTFSDIVLANSAIEPILNQRYQEFKQIFSQMGAPCWAPDPASEGHCLGD